MHYKSSLKWDTGTTSVMKEGNADYAACLENIILKLSEGIYSKDKQDEAKSELKSQFKQFSQAAIAFSWKLENDNKWCDCGTMGHIGSHNLYFKILEGMVKDMVSVEQFHTGQD
jgi:hypothetical protein